MIDKILSHLQGRGGSQESATRRPGVSATLPAVCQAAASPICPNPPSINVFACYATLLITIISRLELDTLLLGYHKLPPVFTSNPRWLVMEAIKRIMIVGQPGSGKSTLARELGRLLKLPVVHIDHIHWQAGWIKRSGPEKDRLCSEVHARDSWIFEGGRSPTWAERLKRADTLIWLDFPLSVRAWRVVCRTIKHYGRTRPDLPGGCPERFSLEFTQWIWNTRKSGRDKMRELFDSAPDTKDKYRVQNKRQVEKLVSVLSAHQT